MWDVWDFLKIFEFYKNFKLLGIDFSKDAIDLARRKIPNGKFKVKNIVVPGLEWMADIDESVNEAPEHDLARELNKASDVILKLIKIYGKKADVDGMTRSWMMGLHAKLKKAGIKIWLS